MRTLSGWGRFPRAECRVVAPKGEAELRSAITSASSAIARGNGRSYGDPALNRETTLLLRHTDRMLDFDSDTGRLEAESGVMLADIIETFLPRGWFVPVTPGTKFVTLGGMIAADVHGKNHHKAGSFGDYVESLELMLADGRVVRCSAGENPELFAATIGGMGLTGVIRSAVFRLIRVESAFIRQEIQRTRDLAQTMEAFEALRERSYSAAWIDCLARGRNLGRSIVFFGEHARVEELPAGQRNNPLAFARRHARRLPPGIPGFALNSWTVKAFNRVYYTANRSGVKIVDYDRFFYPLDAILEWNRLYGPRGLLQYQCVLPKRKAAAGLTMMLDAVGGTGQGSFLSVLKLLGPGRGMLSFPMEGYTLALDFPANPRTLGLLSWLDAIVAAHDGRVYLAKDARMKPQMMDGYPEFAAFRKLRRAADPSGKFSSLQSERLQL